MDIRGDGRRNTVNQCQGCQAGWPLERGMHIVRGGYPGERCLCTKKDYEEKPSEWTLEEMEG